MQNKTFSISRRKAIAGLLTSSAALSMGLVTTPSAFAATQSAFDQSSLPKQLKAIINKSQIAIKHLTFKSKSCRATLKSYKLKTNTHASPLAAADLKASFTAYPVKTTSNPENTGIVTGDDGSSFWFTEIGANRIGKI